MTWLERWQYRLQEEEGEPGAGGGGGGGAPPEDPPGGGEPPPPATIPLDVLPEDLRGRSEGEIKFLLNHMVDGFGSQNTQIQSLQEQLAELRGKVSEPEPEPDPYEGKDLNELILEDAGAAIEKYLKDKGYVGAMSQLGERVGETEFALVSREFEDFEEHEDAVRAYLKKVGVSATKENIRGAYKMVLADSVLESRKKEHRERMSSEPPSGGPPPKKEEDEPQLSALEQEVMKASGFSDPKEWVRLRDADVAAVKVPTG